MTSGAGIELLSVRSPELVAAERVVAALGTTGLSEPRLAIAGGSVTASVGAVRQALGGNWQKTRLTWVDERCVPYDDEASNRGAAYRSGALDESNRPGVELPLFLDDESPELARARVEEILTTHFSGGLDVLLLGMGEDGHIASLFPVHAPWSHVERVAIVRDSPKPPASRITLTLPFLQTAKVNVILACGTGKRRAIERLMVGDSSLPATRLGGVAVVTDQRF